MEKFIHRKSLVNSGQQLSLERKLHRSIRDQNFKEAVKYLNEGADVNEVLNGVTALHLVAGMPAPFGGVFTKLMIQHGAITNVRSVDGQTPIHIAVMWGREETIEILMKHGGQPSLKDNEGQSAFDYLMSKDVKNTEHLIRLLRSENGPTKDAEGRVICNEDIIGGSGEGCEGEDNGRDGFEDGNGDDDRGRMDLMDVSFKDKETIGEKTFDDLFIRHQTSSLRPNFNNSLTTDRSTPAQLNESIVSQHFSFDESSLTFEGSVRPKNWLSLLMCTGPCLYVRRRRRERRGRFRERFSVWLDNMRDRFS